jgi:hypothetical protein
MARHGVVPGLLAMALAGCSGAPFDEKRVFETTFSDPVTLSIPTDRPYVSASDGVNTACIFAKLIQRQAINYLPEPSAAPWVRVGSDSLPIQGNQLQVFSGTRQFVRSVNSRRYSRDGNDYYAATVTYYVTGPSPIPPPSPEGFGPFQARIVYVNDPAVGEWRIQDPLNDDARTVVSRTLTQGDCPQDLVNAASARAYRQSMALITQQLAARGAIARTSDSDVLISTASNLAIFRGWMNENRLDGVSRDVLTQTGRDACSGLHRGPYRWRLPTFQDLYGFTEPYVRGDYRKLLDAPDNSIWGNISEASEGQYYVLESNLPPYNLYEAIFRNRIFSSDTISFSQAHARLICVANLH